MKRAKSKFNKPVNRGVKLYETGGLTSALGSFSPYARGVGSTLDALGPKPQLNDDFMGDEEYARLIGKQQKVQNTFNTLENAAISSGNPYAMAAGVAVKGVRMGLTAAGVGEKKRNIAGAKANLNFGNKASLGYLAQGAQNALPAFKAPAYGKRGMRFKTKFGKPL